MAASVHPMAAMVILVLVALLLSPVGSANAQPEDGVPPSVAITGVGLEGSGCDKNNTVYALSDDKAAVTFMFNNFTASLQGVPESSCRITLQLQSTAGWTLSRAWTIARGYADLDTRVKATHSLTTSISGLTKEKASWFKQRGPFKNDYEFVEKFTQKQGGTIGCNEPQSFNMVSSLSVQGEPGAKGLINVDSADSDLAIKFFWRRCRI